MRQVLDSPALIKSEAFGIYISKITIQIDEMSSTDNFQIRYKNTEAIEGDLIESTEYSNLCKKGSDMF